MLDPPSPVTIEQDSESKAVAILYFLQILLSTWASEATFPTSVNTYGIPLSENTLQTSHQEGQKDK